MRRFLSRKPSPAMAVAFIALLAALSGTAVALPGKNTVDSGDIKKGNVKKSDIAKNAVRGRHVRNGALTGADAKNDSLTGADIQESTLGTVPSANTATSANSANTANSATNASNADTVDGKNAADLESKAFHTQSDTFSDNIGPSTTFTAATLNLPAGSYLIFARGSINNNDGSASFGEVTCELQAGADSHEIENFGLGANTEPNDTEMFNIHLVHTFPAAGTATLSCTTTAGWGSGNVWDPAISAISVQP